MQLASDFEKSLNLELRHLTDLPIYRDKRRLNGGDFFDRELALALCESACMVMIYTPTYFNKEFLYCAREFKAMEILEVERLRLLGYERNYQHGFIIPVIYRGFDVFPPYIGKSRQCHKFDSFHICTKAYLRNNRFLEGIKQIAEYIFARCRELNALEIDPCQSCGAFEIPDREETLRWITPLLPPKPVFPGRSH